MLENGANESPTSLPAPPYFLSAGVGGVDVHVPQSRQLTEDQVSKRL